MTPVFLRADWVLLLTCPQHSMVLCRLTNMCAINRSAVAVSEALEMVQRYIPAHIAFVATPNARKDAHGSAITGNGPNCPARMRQSA